MPADALDAAPGLAVSIRRWCTAAHRPSDSACSAGSAIPISTCNIIRIHNDEPHAPNITTAHICRMPHGSNPCSPGNPLCPGCQLPARPWRRHAQGHAAPAAECACSNKEQQCSAPQRRRINDIVVMRARLKNASALNKLTSLHRAAHGFWQVHRDPPRPSCCSCTAA